MYYCLLWDIWFEFMVYSPTGRKSGMFWSSPLLIWLVFVIGKRNSLLLGCWCPGDRLLWHKDIFNLQLLIYLQCTCTSSYFCSAVPSALGHPWKNPALHQIRDQELTVTSSACIFPEMPKIYVCACMCIQTGWKDTIYTHTCMLQVIKASCWDTLNSGATRQL